MSAAITAPVPGESNRFVMVLPQPDGLVYVGLTDEPVEGPVPDVPEPSEPEIGFLLDVIGTVFDQHIDRAEVVGAFAGLRPLLHAGGRTADLSRRHAVLTSARPKLGGAVVTVVGGKLTTYRRMAQDAVDAVVAQRGLSAGPCRTRHLPLVGAAGREELRRIEAPQRLVRRYGTEAPLLAEDPSMLEPIAEGIAFTMAELCWGVSHEGALDVDDLLDRRTRIGLVPADRARAEAAADAAFSGGRR